MTKIANRILAIAADGRERTIDDYAHRMPDVPRGDVSTVLSKLTREGKLASRTIPITPSVQTYTLAAALEGAPDGRKRRAPPSGPRNAEGRYTASTEAGRGIA
jgi:hypothetical protein